MLRVQSEPPDSERIVPGESLAPARGAERGVSRQGDGVRRDRPHGWLVRRLGPRVDHVTQINDCCFVQMGNRRRASPGTPLAGIRQRERHPKDSLIVGQRAAFLGRKPSGVLIVSRESTQDLFGDVLRQSLQRSVRSYTPTAPEFSSTTLETTWVTSLRKRRATRMALVLPR